MNPNLSPAVSRDLTYVPEDVSAAGSPGASTDGLTWFSQQPRQEILTTENSGKKSVPECSHRTYYKNDACSAVAETQPYLTRSAQRAEEADRVRALHPRCASARSFANFTGHLVGCESFFGKVPRSLQYSCLTNSRGKMRGPGRFALPSIPTATLPAIAQCELVTVHLT